jgi:hypothetical protein
LNYKSNLFCNKTNQFFSQSHNKCILVSQAPTYAPTRSVKPTVAALLNGPVEPPLDAPISPASRTIPTEAPNVNNIFLLSEGMGMGMGTEKTGMSMVEGIMGMGMGRDGGSQCKLDCCDFIDSNE